MSRSLQSPTVVASLSVFLLGASACAGGGSGVPADTGTGENDTGRGRPRDAESDERDGNGPGDPDAGAPEIDDPSTGGDPPGSELPDTSPVDAEPDLTPVDADAADLTPIDSAIPDLTPADATVPDLTPLDAATDSSDAAEPRCGDGIEQGSEECDDGNTVDEDGCTNACTLATCGDGIRNDFERTETFTSPVVTNPFGVSGHVCDDGSYCSATCDLASVPTAPEHGICESLGFDFATNVAWGDGAGDSDSSMPHASNWSCVDFDCGPSTNSYSGDNCSRSEMLNSITCTGVYTEECDYGDLNAELPDRCRPDCVLPFCGDGVIDSGEACDEGDANADLPGAPCRTDCSEPRCGDAVVDPGEACDDGNDNDDDGCHIDCSRPTCGDGVVTTYRETARFDEPVVTNPYGARGHVCDDGGSCEGGACDVSTRPTAPEHGVCESLGWDFANYVDWGGGAGESDVVMPHAFNWRCTDFDCTGGSTGSYDNCATSEMLEYIECERNYVEECDNGIGNADLPDLCRTNCKLPTCGDDILDTGEECDEGAANSDASDAACRTTCRLPYCGDGVLDTGEQCDDGNVNNDDGCSSLCLRDGGCSVLVLWETANGAPLETLLETNGFEATAVSNATPRTSADPGAMALYDVIVFYKSDRSITTEEVSALELYVSHGGRVIATGYDSLGSPTDAQFADFLRVNTGGDLTGVSACSVINDSFAPMNGAFGSFPIGTSFTVTETDHDAATADDEAGSISLIRLGTTSAKFTFAPGIGEGGGTVYYWNGNYGFSDWLNIPTARGIFLNTLAFECGD